MSCKRTDELLARGAPMTEPDVVEHIEQCPGCRARAHAGGADAALFGRLGAALRTEDAGRAAALRSLPTSRRLALAALVAVATILASYFAAGRVDFALYPVPRLSIELAGLLAATLIALWVALRPAWRPPLAPAALTAAAVLALAGPSILAMLPAAHTLHPASLAGAGADLGRRAIACLMYGLACGAVMSLYLLLVRRDDRPPGVWTTLGAGAAGLAGVAALQVHCPITQPVHLLLGHGPVVLVMLGVWALAWRVRRRHRP